MFTMALVRNGFHDLPETFHTYIIKKDGVEVGELKYDRGRWKSAGGPAWQGRITCRTWDRNVTFYSKKKKEVLEFFKKELA